MTTLVKHENQDLQTLKQMAVVAFESGKYSKTDYNEATIMNIFLTAKALGVDPMMALNGGFNIIKGKINMGAHFMAALIRRKGHSVQVLELSEQKCVILAKRKDNGDSLKYEYTIQDAVKAGVSRKDNWVNYTKQMLYCSCIKNVSRILFPDLVGIAYDEEEMKLTEPTIQINDAIAFATEEIATIESTPVIDRLSDEQCAQLDSLFLELDDEDSKTKLQTFFKIESVFDLPVQEYDKVVRSLKKKIKDKEEANANASAK